MTSENHMPDANPVSLVSISPAPKKKSRAIWFFLIPAFVFLIMLTFTKKPQQIAWLSDLDAATKLAQKQHKPLMISIYAVWSDHCIDMKEKTYSEPAAIRFVEKNFVPVLIDADKNPSIVEKYKITVFPTQIIFLPDTQQFALVPGRHPTTNFIDRLTKGLAKLNLTPVPGSTPEPQ